MWADIVCPWCYVGEARLEKAAAALTAQADVTITPHAFELDPNHSHPERVLDMLARKYGRTADEAVQMDSRVASLAAEEGLPYTSDRVTANTFDAHRLVAAAAEFGVAIEVLRALQKGHFSGELDLSDGEALIATVASVGLPEARINLAQAVIHIALAPKSNAVVRAIGAAQDDVAAGRTGAVPAHLRDAHYPGARRLGHGQGYVYPHDLPEGIVAQQYAPDVVNGRAYYEPSGHGMESRFSERARLIRQILHAEQAGAEQAGAEQDRGRPDGNPAAGATADRPKADGARADEGTKQ